MIVLEVYVVCDKCGKRFLGWDGDGIRSPQRIVARRKAQKAGWVIAKKVNFRQHEYCPSCGKEIV